MAHLWSGKIVSNRCPSCGKQLDAATATTLDIKRGPISGDITVCINCITVLQYQKDLQLKILSKNEQDRLPVEVTMQICKIRLAITMIQQRHKDGKIP